jgi:hypothetical protein
VTAHGFQTPKKKKKYFETDLISHLSLLSVWVWQTHSSWMTSLVILLQQYCQHVFCSLTAISLLSFKDVEEYFSSVSPSRGKESDIQAVSLLGCFPATTRCSSSLRFAAVHPNERDSPVYQWRSNSEWATVSLFLILEDTGSCTWVPLDVLRQERDCHFVWYWQWCLLTIHQCSLLTTDAESQRSRASLEIGRESSFWVEKQIRLYSKRAKFFSLLAELFCCLTLKFCRSFLLCL